MWSFGRIRRTREVKFTCNTPANCLTVQADFSEFDGLRAFVPIGHDRSNGNNPSIDEREDEIAGYNLPHEFVKGSSWLHWNCASGTRAYPP
jgi:hypothetical protein